MGIGRAPSEKGFAPIALSHFYWEMNLRSYAKMLRIYIPITLSPPNYVVTYQTDLAKQAVVLIIIFCTFIQHRLWADDFQIPPHRQAIAVTGKHKHQ